MKVAIIGGGISGLMVAYECEKLGLDWQLYEGSARLGGIVETTQRDGFVLEGGPDGWVSEKPWLRELCIELGLESELIFSNDPTRKTYVAIQGKLVAMPERMRLMVPEDLAALEGSPLFSDHARAAYAAELSNAESFRSVAPAKDESVASFVRRHFGEEVLEKLAAPLLSGVFGGDVEELSVQAVMPAFVAMEREHGSLIAALQARRKARGGREPQPIFTSLRNGMSTLTDTLKAKLPPERLHLERPALSIKREGKLWCVRSANPAIPGNAGKTKKHFHAVMVAASLDSARALLQPIDAALAPLLPDHASSCVLVSFAWKQSVALPQGFGFLVAQGEAIGPQLLACTFSDQKFPGRAPEGGRVMRAFFGGASADDLALMDDGAVTALAFEELQKYLGELPELAFSVVRRWPRSLPQYAVGHLERMQLMDAMVADLPGLTLLGNSYRGVGLPDLVRDAKAAVRALVRD